MRNCPSAAVIPPGDPLKLPPLPEMPLEGCIASMPKRSVAAPIGPIAVPATQYDGDFFNSTSTPSRFSPGCRINVCALSLNGEFGYQVRTGTRLDRKSTRLNSSHLGI